MSAAQLTPQERCAIQTAVGNKLIGKTIADKLDGTETSGTTAISAAYATVDEQSAGVVHQTTITLNSYSLTMTDNASDACYGGVKIFDFPEGNILILGCTASLAVTKSGSGINADFDGDFSVGTATAGADATLSSTEANVIASTATPQAVSGVTTATGINTAAIDPLDGTATAKDLYLNFLVDYGDQTGGGALLLTGTVKTTWVNLGDK